MAFPYKVHFDTYCAENALEIALSFVMPAGYESAFGTFDVTENTLFINASMLESAPEYEALFYLFHELRHAQQYIHPERFDESLRRSLPYVILYNGKCYKLTANSWRECDLEGCGEYFSAAYLSLPYEIDANTFAYQKVASLLGYSEKLRELHSAWIPEQPLSAGELEALFREIDLKTLSLCDIQPSQFYLSEEKILAIQQWFSPDDLSNFEALPIKLLNGRMIFTDGHTRAYSAWKAGLDKVPLVWDTDELDWEMYRRCVDACLGLGISSVADLDGRILSAEDYKKKWNGWCDEMQRTVNSER